MPYGTLKADTLTYYTATGDVNLAISGIAISGSPLISGVSGVFTTSVSGATVTGNAGQFTTITGGTAEFTNITGVSGTFTSRISGATVTGTSGQFTTLTATTGVFTTSISGATISGDVGLFTTISGSQGVFNSGLSVPSGTAASPSISFNGDPNTGLYSTGADAVAISTNGTGRLFVDSSGRVGIGTTSPDTTLSVNGDGSLGSLNGAAPVITLKNVNSTNYNASAIVNRDSGGNIGCGISFRNDSHGASGYSALLFWTRNVGVIRNTLTIGSNGTTEFNSSASTSPAIFKINDSEVSRIDSSGRLLIGTSSARSTVSAGTATPSLQLEGTTFPASALSIVRNESSGSGAALVLGRSNGTTTGSNTTISDGNGIGFLSFQGADGTNLIEAARISAFADGGVSTNDMPGRLVFSTTADGASSPTERMRIDSSGRVGIGTTAVDVKTQIVKNALTKSWSADGDDVLAIENSGTTNVDFRSGSSSSTYLMFSDGDARARGYVAYLHSSDALLLGAANSERARIDSSGRLLVGTSSGQGNSFLQIKGDAGGSTGIGSIFLQRGLTVAAIGSSGNVDLAKIEFGNQDGAVGAVIQANADATWSTNDYPSRLTFSTTADGASSPTERVRISQNGVVTVKNGAVAEIGTLTDGATVTPDFAANCNFTLTISGNRTLANPTNITAGQTGSIFIIQGTGSNTLSWGSYWDFAGGTAPTLSTASGAVDRVDYVVRTSTSIHTVFTANYS